MLIYSLPKRPCDRFGFDGVMSNEAKATLLERLFNNMSRQDRHLYFLRSEGEQPFEGHSLEYETTVDGCHPNDYGFMIMAKELFRKITEIRKKESEVSYNV